MKLVSICFSCKNFRTMCELLANSPDTTIPVVSCCDFEVDEMEEGICKN